MRQEVLRPVDVAVALALVREPGQGYEPLEIAEGLEIRVPAPPVLLPGELVAAFLPETRQVPELRSSVTDRVAALRKNAG